MRTTSRVGARTIGMVAASGAALLLAPGIALADHDELSSCDSRHYPPSQCEAPSGGAGSDAPPLQASPSEKVPPGTPVSMSASGCEPGAAVVIGLAQMTSPAKILGLTTTNADGSGAYSTSAAIPADLPDGSYVMYGECRAPGSTDTTVSTTSFTVQSAPTASLRTSGSAVTSSGTDAEAGQAAPAATAAALPASFVPPTGWSASPEVKAAVTEAVNLRLAAMRAALPAQTADVTAAPAAAATADYTPWYAAAGAGALLLLGAAGWRRRATVGDDTNSEASA